MNTANSTRPLQLALATVLLALAPVAQGKDLCDALTLDVHLYSFHTAIPYSYDNNNYGLGASCHRGEWSVSTGGYHNSYGNTSIYATAAYAWPVTGWLDAGVTGGVATGYRAALWPIGGVFATAKAGEFSFTTVVGVTSEQAGAVIHFVLSKRI